MTGQASHKNRNQEVRSMAKYLCTVCGYIYDEAEGEASANIAPGTKWADVPEDFECPLCGVGKDSFELEA
jgi:rubredoxin